MRRTYRSKKESSDALDHKDVLLTMDEKSSAFDAFYIQNIKQTKREMSSVHLHAAHSKVRKRKYVRRIIKDVEPVHRDSVLESVYLTPNKSLHVNKPLDPFDQLLNSSTTENHGARGDKIDVFSKIRKEEKKYTKRKLARIRKYNYSTSDSSDSEKENSKNETKETSNIKMHKLLIEKDEKTSPKYFDRSINDLVQKITVSKKSDKQSTPVGLAGFNFIRNRLTTDFQSPILQSSPLCSTPFKEKYRGASIYNFSPINYTNNFNDRRNCLNISNGKETVIKNNITGNLKNDTVRNDDYSLSDVSLHSIPVERRNDKFAGTETSDNCIKSSISSETCKHVRNVTENYSHSMREEQPLDNMSLVTSTKSHGISDGDNSIRDLNNKSDSQHSKSMCEEKSSNITAMVNVTDNECQKSSIHNSKEKSDSHVSYSTCKQPLNNKSVIDKQIYENFEDLHPINDLKENSDNFAIPSIEISSLQTTELEPFLGFLVSDQKTEVVKEVDYKDYDSEISVNSCDEEITCNESDIENSLASNLCESKTSNSDKSLEKSIILCKIVKKDAGVNYVLKSNDSHLSCKASSIRQSENFDTSMSSQDDNVSMYDTCDSGQSLHNTSEILCTKEPIVVLEKIDDCVFRKYHEKMIAYETEGRNITYAANERRQSSCDDDSTGNSINDCNDNGNSQENNDFNTSSEISDDSDAEGDLNRNTEEDRCISFVTTRRRNEVANDSMISYFNDSNESKSSLSGDKTVLSNNNINVSVDENCDLAAGIKDVILINHSPVEEINRITEEGNAHCTNPVTSVSNVMTRQSSRTSKSSVIEISTEPKKLTQETQPSIVLQPGKKWERSLSIYRRMTMMTDNFDHSILDDERMHCKGRKYRQSVISTMEMQDFGDSLHNDSINSRRSTFVFKPCRSTIKIVKEPNNSRLSLSTTAIFDDLKGIVPMTTQAHFTVGGDGPYSISHTKLRHKNRF